MFAFYPDLVETLQPICEVRPATGTTRLQRLVFCRLFSTIITKFCPAFHCMLIACWLLAHNWKKNSADWSFSRWTHKILFSKESQARKVFISALMSLSVAAKLLFCCRYQLEQKKKKVVECIFAGRTCANWIRDRTDLCAVFFWTIIRWCTILLTQTPPFVRPCVRQNRRQWKRGSEPGGDWRQERRRAQRKMYVHNRFFEPLA